MSEKPYSTEIDEYMGFFKKENKKWRHCLLRMNLGVAYFVLLVEVVMFFILLVTEQIEQSLPEYLFRFLILPTVIDFSVVTVESILLKKFPQEDSLQNNLAIITLILICTIVASAHYVFSMTLTLFCMPILTSVIFCDRKIVVNAFFMSIAGFVVALLCRYFYRFPSEDPSIITDMIVSSSILILCEGVAQLLMNMLKERNDKLCDAIVEAKRSQLEAVNATKAKSIFLANMSHEIRTPINAILGMNEMFLRNEKDEILRDYAYNVQTAGKSLLAIINDVLDITKIESGKMEIVPVKYEVSSLINDSYNMVAGRASEKNLELTVDSSENIPAGLWGDEIHLRQVIVNLLTNAIKYTESGSVSLNVSGSCKNDEYILHVSVTDTGIGISEENISQLFDQFKRFDLLHSRNIEGTGLGLAITNNLVELMNGKISVESKLGEGSTFTVDIPQKVYDPTPSGKIKIVASDHSYVYKQSFEAPDAQILVVDDIPINLKVFASMLIPTKVKVDTADSGRKCLELTARKRYDIIFMDHMMPEMDGVQTFVQLRSNPDSPNINTPVIMLTANALSGVKDEYVQMGFADYLSKPVMSDKLEKMIIQYLPDELVNTDIRDEEPSESETASRDVSVSSDPVEDDPVSGNDLPDKLKAVMPEINIDNALTYCCGSEELLVEIIHDYIDCGRHEKLDAAMSANDFDNYRILVHSLKSASLTIGLSELSEKAKESEFALKEGNTDFARHHHEELLVMLDDAVDRLRSFIKSIES
ncbi:MAG: ATP-binding protein [Huintestinicola sp.]